MIEEELRKKLLEQTHWSPFNVILRENNLCAPDDLDEELLEFYKELWISNPGKTFNEDGVREDLLDFLRLK